MHSASPMPEIPTKHKSARPRTAPIPETPTKRKPASPRATLRKKRAARLDERKTVCGAGTEAEVLEYLGRFRPSSGGDRDAVTDEKLVLLLRGVAAGQHGNCELRQFIIAYGAVRTFAGLRAEKLDSLSPITGHLQARWASIRASPASVGLPSSAVVCEVDGLAEACRLAGFHRNLSFASKALAMLGFEIPIYSSEGKAYLGLPASVGYGAFFDAWMDAYGARRAAYEVAAAAHLADAGLERELGVAWFAMRGFDVHLMAVGGPMRKK